MKTFSIIQEILLITTTTLSQKQFCDLNPQEGTRHLHPTEQLEQACWNGLVNELIPEIMQTPGDSEKIFLWQVETRKSYIKMSWGSCFPVLEKEHSLDPHTFLSSMEMN